MNATWPIELRLKALEAFAAHNGEATDAVVIDRHGDGRWTGLSWTAAAEGPRGPEPTRQPRAGSLLQAILEDLSSGRYGEI